MHVGQRYRAAPGGENPSIGPGELEAWVAELGDSVFAPLGRRDQRLQAERYTRGLLTATGRKTLRNIADQVGGEAARQSTHHFISGSPWEWTEVRRALAAAVERLTGPRTLVVLPTVVPRVGTLSVGVEKQFVPHLGQTVVGQQAYGAWLASADAAVPVNWRLVLPPSWSKDTLRRRMASIPEEIGPETPEECASAVALEPVRDWGVSCGLVVLDSEGLDIGGCLRHFDRAGMPLVMRVSPSTPLRIDCKTLQGYGDREIQAEQLVESMKRMRRPLECQDPWGRPVQDAVAAVIPVVPAQTPVPRRDPDRPLLLVAHWPGRERRPAKLWLTTASDLPLATVVELTELADVVTRDFLPIAENVGLRDFGGRSFQGWHRHITMASVAHLAAVLAGPENFPATRTAGPAAARTG
ncbi:transposase [Streptomyces sp. TRM76323]|uniref:Transposase n=1 Tax=Streptomyces tamarix TaxID=3078565 RepID=A0ABU3QD47_9ACTN|nr:transposase [Streptomyces tamarix]MDT9680684.1 transposase [Streptomyces tamarix]